MSKSWAPRTAAGDDLFGTERGNTRNRIIDFYYEHYKTSLDNKLISFLEASHSLEHCNVELAARLFLRKRHYKVQGVARNLLDFQGRLTRDEDFKIRFQLSYHGAHLPCCAPNEAEGTRKALAHQL